MSQGGSLSGGGSSGGVPTPTSLNRGDVVYAPSANTMAGLPISSSYGAPLGASDSGLPAYLTPNQYIYLVDDFMSGASRSDGFSSLGWNFEGSNSVSLQVVSTISAAHPGLAWFNLNGSFNWTTFFLSQNGNSGLLILGAGLIVVNYWIQLTQLSNSSNRFYVKLGLGDSQGESDDNNSIAFRYEDNVNSGNWQCLSESGGTYTTVNTAVAADTGWHKFTIVVNTSATSIGYYINGSLVGTITTNIPTAPISPSVQFQNSGTYTSGIQTMLLDLFTLYIDLTTPR